MRAAAVLRDSEKHTVYSVGDQLTAVQGQAVCKCCRSFGAALYGDAGQAAFELYAAARAMGGEVSGEHGIGHAKRGFLRESVGEVQLNLMRGIKAAFDPNGILNPGKVV